jgi:hypothetical protein
METKSSSLRTINPSAPACNTRLSVIARNALRPILGDDSVADIERQAEAGTLTLGDLGSLADQ